MDQITGALIGIALVLSAVFVPMAFFGGSTGVIYRQFDHHRLGHGAPVIGRHDPDAGAVRLDLLADPQGRAPRSENWFFRGFNKIFDRSQFAMNRDVGKMLWQAHALAVVITC